MTELPFEILRLISQFSWRQDLLQFQLVNKQWHEASSESLYSQIIIQDDRAALSYIHTISKSPRFALYLKTFRCYNMFQTYLCDPIMWDKNNILSTIVKYCVNLRRLRPPHGCSPMLWTRLIFAASQGQLPNLQILPDIADDNIELYVCTALAFRKSLIRLHLVDHVSEYRRAKYTINARFFQDLLDRIKEFSNLKELLIRRCTNQPFSQFVDSILDDCPHLIELDVNIRESDLQAPIRQDVLAIPKPNISKLTCAWRRIYKDDELKYVMRKFPNLQDLHLKGDYRIDSHDKDCQAYETSYNVMMEFIKYFSSIKKIDLSFACKRRDIVCYWKEFCKLRKTEASKNVSIDYDVFTDDTLASMTFTEKKLQLAYLINSIGDVLPHEEFLSEHSDEIKDLSVDYTSYAYKNLDSTSSTRYLLSNENWIYQILRSCPSLENLQFINLVELKLPGNSSYQHTKLKKLKIVDDEDITSLKFLKNLSLYVPNLKELEITSYHHIDSKNGYCIEIDMPYTTFDIIKMEFDQALDSIEDYFVKLNTFVDEKYYHIDSAGKHELTHNAYLKSKKRCLYEITCRGLKTLELMRIDTEANADYYSTIHFIKD